MITFEEIKKEYTKAFDEYPYAAQNALTNLILRDEFYNNKDIIEEFRLNLKFFRTHVARNHEYEDEIYICNNTIVLHRPSRLIVLVFINGEFITEFVQFTSTYNSVPFWKSERSRYCTNIHSKGMK